MRCRTRVHTGRRTINRRLTVPTISQRGSYSEHAQASILDTWRTLPTAHLPSLHLSRSSSLAIPISNRHFPSQHVEGAEAANSLLTRDRLPLARRMSCRTNIQRDVARESNSSHVNFVEECLHPDTNLKVAQRCQHGIPYVVLSSNENVEEVTDPFIARRK